MDAREQLVGLRSGARDHVGLVDVVVAAVARVGGPAVAHDRRSRLDVVEQEPSEHLGARVLDELAVRVNQYTSMRAMAKVKAGQLPGPEMSIGKLALTNNMLRISRFVERTLGPRIVADTGEWGTYSWGKFILGVPGMRLGGGTDEVMHNIIGERVLGLPKDSPPPNPA